MRTILEVVSFSAFCLAVVSFFKHFMLPNGFFFKKNSLEKKLLIIEKNGNHEFIRETRKRVFKVKVTKVAFQLKRCFSRGSGIRSLSHIIAGPE